MIYTGQTHKIANQLTVDYEEIWCCMLYPTRSVKHAMMHHPELAPSSWLFNKYHIWLSNGVWNAETFNNKYTPIFLSELKQNETAKKSLNWLYLNRSKNIVLACACSDETLCHRMILRSLLYGACKGDNVFFDRNINIDIYKMYKEI